MDLRRPLSSSAHVSDSAGPEDTKQEPAPGAVAQPPCRLVNLPTELLRLICHAALEDTKRGKILPYHPHEWIRLGRTCKRLHHVVQPFLYEHVMARNNQSPYEHPRRLNLGCLIRTLWINPDLGLLVRHIVLDSGPSLRWSRSRTWPDLVRGSVDDNRSYLSKAIERHLGVDMAGSSPPVPAPSSMAQWCRESAVPLFLLLSMAPNVTSLQTYLHCQWELDDGLAQRAFPNLTSLRLRSYCWDRSRQDGCECQAAMGKFLGATPSLDSLELDCFGILEGRLILPPRLTSLVLVDTWYASGSDSQGLVRGLPQLKRFYTYNEKYRKRLTPPLLRTELLEPLSQSRIADTLVTLGLCGSRLDAVPAVDMGRFRALQVLGINCGLGEWWSIGLLLKSIRDCPCLRELVVDGADKIPREELLPFARAVSRLEYPTLRKITLAPRDVVHFQIPGNVPHGVPHPLQIRGRFQKTLQGIAKEPIPGLLQAGGVELVLHERGSNKDIRGLFAEIEEAP